MSARLKLRRSEIFVEMSVSKESQAWSGAVPNLVERQVRDRVKMSLLTELLHFALRGYKDVALDGAGEPRFR